MPPRQTRSPLSVQILNLFLGQKEGCAMEEPIGIFNQPSGGTVREVEKIPEGSSGARGNPSSWMPGERFRQRKDNLMGSGREGEA